MTTPRGPKNRAVIALCLAALLAGCHSFDAASATTFSTGVSAVRSQTTTAFGALTAITRTAAIDYAADTGELRENELEGVPSPATMNAWNHVLEPVERYAQQLAALGSGGKVADVEGAVGDLARQYNATAAELSATFKLPESPAVAARPVGAVAEVAGAFLRARSAAQAAAVARTADPAVRKILTTLADAIGASNSSGLRQVVRNHWTLRLSDARAQFRTTDSAAARRPLAEKYVAMLEQRDAQDRQLAMLRSSYLALADAHSALAQRNETGLRSAVTFITAELGHAQALQLQVAQTLHR
jgi:hypothetical protein